MPPCAQRDAWANGAGGRTGQGGFTLMEMLVALAIFAVVGGISATLMSQVLANEANMGVRSARLGEVQRAMLILKRDLMQITRRPVRDMLGDPLPPVMIGSNGLIEFSRLGWRNPLGFRRAEVQRVAYQMQDGNLLRTYWNVLDRSQDSEPSTQRLLEDVQQVEFIALDANGDDHSFWPLRFGADGDAGSPPLAAILMRLECRPFGVVERIWLVAGGEGGAPMGGGNRAG